MRAFNHLMRLPAGVREIVIMFPSVGLLLLLFGYSEVPDISGKVPMYKRTDAPLTSYHLEPVYDEHGKIKYYIQVKHKPTPS